MEVIRENREAKQIDPEAGRELLERLFDPDLAMIEVLSAELIVTHQETSADGAIVDVSDVDFAGVEHFTAGQTHGGSTTRQRQDSDHYEPT